MSHNLAPLQAVTHNLPPFIRQPLIALISKECYTSLVWNLDLSDTECIKYSASKVVGLGLVAGGAIVKVPQILKVLQSGSARGLSLSSYLLDTASLLITVAYNVRQQFPFSTYGENVFLSIQNVVIAVLIIAYSHTAGKAGKAITFLAAVGGAGYALASDSITPLSALQGLLAASIPLSLASKVPQIIQNASNGSTGQLSAFLVFNSLLGTLARVFTTATETGDKTLWWSYVCASLLNGVIALQMLWYWKASTPKGQRVQEKIQEARRLAQPVAAEAPLQGKIPVGATPAKPVNAGNGGPPKSASRSAPRSASSKYTRKVD